MFDSNYSYDPSDDDRSEDGHWTDWGVDGNGPTGTGPVTRDGTGNIVPESDDD